MRDNSIRVNVVLLIFLALIGFYSAVTKFTLPHFLYYFFVAILASVQIGHVKRGNILIAMTVVPLSLLIVIGVLLDQETSLPDLPRFPKYVFTEANTSIVLGTSLLAASLFLLVAGALAPRVGWNLVFSTHMVRTSREKQVIILLLALAIILSVLTVPGTTVLSAAYATAEQRTGRMIDSAGLKIVAIGSLTTTLAVAASAFGIRSRNYKTVGLMVLCVSIYFYFLRGDRGGTLPVVITVVLLYLMMSEDSMRRKLMIVSFFGVIGFILLMMMSYFRANAATLGVAAAASQSFSFAMGAFSGAEVGAKSGLLQLPLLPQSFWHGLHTADLYERGNSLGGRSFLDIIPQSLPKFATDIVDYERPLNGAWLLGKYRIHGGGMNSVALAYWNLGIMGVIIFSTALAFLISILENWYRRQLPSLIGTYVLIGGSLPYVLLYGWQPLIKMVEIAFILALIIRLMLYGGQNLSTRQRSVERRFA
jgi:hypothetical protein